MDEVEHLRGSGWSPWEGDEPLGLAGLGASPVLYQGVWLARSGRELVYQGLGAGPIPVPALTGATLDVAQLQADVNSATGFLLSLAADSTGIQHDFIAGITTKLNQVVGDITSGRANTPSVASADAAIVQNLINAMQAANFTNLAAYNAADFAAAVHGLGQLQVALQTFAQQAGNIPPPNPNPPPPLPAPSPTPTPSPAPSSTTAAAATTGMSTGEKVAIGIVAVGAVGILWALAASGKKHHRRSRK